MACNTGLVPEIFEQMRAGGLNAVHVTVAYKNTRETLTDWESGTRALRPSPIRYAGL